MLRCKHTVTDVCGRCSRQIKAKISYTAIKRKSPSSCPHTHTHHILLNLKDFQSICQNDFRHVPPAPDTSFPAPDTTLSNPKSFSIVH